MRLRDSIHSQLESSRPECPNCGTLMWLARIEPDKPGYDKRTFECPQCDRNYRGREIQVEGPPWSKGWGSRRPPAGHRTGEDGRGAVRLAAQN